MSLLIIFDIDGTLTQTYHSEDDTYLRALSHYLDFPKDYHYAADCRHLTDSAVMDFMFERFAGRLPDEAEVKGMQNTYLELLAHRKKSKPSIFDEIPGAKKLVKQLQARPDVTVGVATGNWRCVAEYKLAQIGVSMPPPFLIGADEEHSKSRFLQQLVERLSADQQFPGGSWYLGDSIKDYEAATYNNMQFVGVDFRANGRLQKMLKTEAIISDYQQTNWPWNQAT